MIHCIPTPLVVGLLVIRLQKVESPRISQSTNPLTHTRLHTRHYTLVIVNANHLHSTSAMELQVCHVDVCFPKPEVELENCKQELTQQLDDLLSICRGNSVKYVWVPFFSLCVLCVCVPLFLVFYLDLAGSRVILMSSSFRVLVGR
jgi:hypothetical protein